MAQGILSGALWGLALSAVVLVVGSQVMERPVGDAPAVPQRTLVPGNVDVVPAPATGAGDGRPGASSANASVAADGIRRPGTAPVPGFDPAGAAAQGRRPPLTSGGVAPIAATRAAPAAGPASVDADTPPLVRFASPAQDAGDRPLMSILLVDDGTMADAAARVAELSVPVTVVIDPAAPDSVARARAYRAAGVEIAARANLPAGAVPDDVPGALAQTFAAVPEAVALVNLDDEALTSSRGMVERTLRALAESGHGFAAVAQGLGMPLEIAETVALPSVPIVAGPGREDATAATRSAALDEAADRVAEQGPLAVQALLSEATLAALADWRVPDAVALVPLSAALIAQTR